MVARLFMIHEESWLRSVGLHPLTAFAVLLLLLRYSPPPPPPPLLLHLLVVRAVEICVLR
jgi:hypothetical protein